MRPFLSKARLVLNGKDVGLVKIRGWQASWGFGEFQPNDQFAEFAPIFGNWSLLMHADDDEQRLTPAASEELRRAECQMDALRALLLLGDTQEPRTLRQVNIDGNLIEWKE
jgi:hypothetical protein